MAKFGLVFPGQGSQYPGMGKDLHRNYKSVRDIFADASEVVGRDMVSLCFEGPQEALDLTINTQVSVLTADLAAWRAFSERMVTVPIVMAGHSLGEYAALHAAGAVSLRDVLFLVNRRAQYHQEAVPVGEGAMAAILGLARHEVIELCGQVESAGFIVSLSIENAPGQIVVSGHAAAVEKVIAAAQTREGVRAVKLAISVPCHSPLLKEAAGRLAEVLNQVDFRDCTVPVIPNCSPDLLYTKEHARELLARQITSPVRWLETIEKMAAMGVDTIVEIGPKRILSGLVRRIDRRLRLLNVEDTESLEKTVTALND